MQFSDTSNLTGIVEKIDFELGTDSNTYTLKDKARECNLAMDEVYNIIFKTDQTFQFDDNNSTDLPIATTDLNQNQTDYTFDVDHLKVLRVEVKNSNGDWTRIKEKDLKDIETSIKDYRDTAGDPQYYDLFGTQIYLYPPSDTTVEGGLRVHFQRSPSQFASTDTTKKPGFASIFHEYIPIYACWSYCKAKPDLQDKASSYKFRLMELKEEIKDYYSSRNEDTRKRMTPKYRSAR